MDSTTSHSGHQELSAAFQRAVNACENGQLIVSRYGYLTREDVNEIAYSLEKRLKDDGEGRGTIKRLFNILIETLQNIRLHGSSLPDGNKDSYVVVCKSDDTYRISCGNFIEAEREVELNKRISTLNQMDEDALQRHYVEVLTDGQISGKGGAGLGFITIALKSKNPLEALFSPIQTDEGFRGFHLETTVN